MMLFYFVFIPFLPSIDGFALFDDESLVQERPPDSKYEKTFLMVIQGALTDPLPMEAKAYCSAGGFLDRVYLTTEEIEALPKVEKPSWKTKSDSYVPLNSSWPSNEPIPTFPSFYESIRTNRIPYLANSDLHLRNLKGYAISEKFWFDADGLPIWFGLSDDFNEISVKSDITEGGYTMTLHSSTYYKFNLDWYPANKKLDYRLYKKTQEFLSKRAKQIKENYITYIRPLHFLFYNDNLSSEFYTKEMQNYLHGKNQHNTTAEILQKSKFVVQGCAEKRASEEYVVIVLAVNLVPASSDKEDVKTQEDEQMQVASMNDVRYPYI